MAAEETLAPEKRQRIPVVTAGPIYAGALGEADGWGSGGRIECFRGLLAHLATLTKNTIEPTGDLPAFDRLTVPTPLQQRAFDLLGVSIPG